MNDQKNKVLPIIYGVLVSLVGYILTLVIIGLTLGYLYGSQNRTLDELAVVLESSVATIIMVATAMLFVILGGFIASRTARYSKKGHTALLGRWLLGFFVLQVVVMFVFGVKTSMLGWLVIFTIAFSIIPLTLFGGSLATHRRSPSE